MKLLVALLCSTCPLCAQQTVDGLPSGSEAWYLPAPGGTGELFVYEIGTGEGAPVVVLHGGPGGELTPYLPVARGLTDEFHFVFYDQRGSLRSNVPLDSISMANHVEDLEALRRALGAERIRILSHSAGTNLAFEYLRAYPDRVAELVLVGALPHKNGTPYYDAEYASYWEEIPGQREAYDRWHRPLVDAEVQRIENDSSLTSEKRTAAIRVVLRQLDGDVVHIERWRSQIPVRVRAAAAARTRESTNFEYNFAPELAAHPFAVTVINGQFDFTVGPEGSPLWRRLSETEAPNVTVEVIPNAGHSVWVDEPQLFEDALRVALNGDGPH